MAVATAAGMFSSTILTLVVVPVLYLVLDDLSEWLRGRGRRRSVEVARPGPAEVPGGRPAAELVARPDPQSGATLGR
jgi:hypothetical protein